MAFIDDDYDTDVNFQIMIGLPFGKTQSLGYCDDELSETHYTIAIAPGKMSLEGLIATTLHELIHAYCGEMNHNESFIFKCSELGLIYRKNEIDLLTSKAKEKIEHILKIIGRPPYGLITELESNHFNSIRDKWATCSTIYCTKCDWKNLLFFSNKKINTQCAKCGSDKIYEISNHPSMILTDAFNELPVSSPWCGDISPIMKSENLKLKQKRLIKTCTFFLSRKLDRLTNLFPLLITPISDIDFYEENLKDSIGRTNGWSLSYIENKSWLYEFDNDNYGIIQTARTASTFNQLSLLDEYNLPLNNFVEKLLNSNDILKDYIFISETTKANEFESAEISS